MTSDLYNTVTATILTQMEAGAAPWVKPWSGKAYGSSMPRNAASDRAYSGVNIPVLWIAQEAGAYASPRWLTFKQAIDAGGNVRKGEKGTAIVFVSAVEVEAEGSEETRRIPFLKRYTVFNAAQCDGLPERITAGETIAPRNHEQRLELADEFLASTGALIVEGSGEAFYRPATDSISMPAFASFKSSDHFYSAAFHELGHWTGAKQRLDRDLRGRFGDQSYAAEELVAELCAAFLCAEFGLDGDLRHAGYLASWIKLLKSDSRAFFTASARAQKAVDYLRELALAAPALPLLKVA